jgi:hypothetical protein
VQKIWLLLLDPLFNKYFLMLPRYKPTSVPAEVIYNKEKEIISSWGEHCKNKLDKVRGDERYMDEFLSELHRIFLKSDSDWNENDTLILKVVANFLQLLANVATEEITKQQRNARGFDESVNFHFVFVLPNQCAYDFSDKIIRPIFIASGLISETDHLNRLLVFTELDCSLQQLFRSPHSYYYCFTNDKHFNAKRDLKKGAPYLLCNFDVTVADGLFVLSSDAFEFQSSLAAGDSFDTGLIPKPFVSTIPKISFDKRVETSLLNLLNSKEDFDENQGSLQEEGILENIILIMMRYLKDRNKVKDSTITTCSEASSSNVLVPSYYRSMHL